jgi:hypothetical protein
MTPAVTLYDGYFRIDARVWLHQRIGARHDDRSSHLQVFARSDVFDLFYPVIDIAGRMQLWCAAHGFSRGDGTVLEYDDSCLSEAVTIVLAATSSVPPEAVALVSVGGAAPEVYADVTTDEGYWREAATIVIVCPDGHRWTWDGGRHLCAAGGSDYHAGEVLRAGPVIGRCRDCVAFDDGATEDLCPCPGVAIYCPVCDRRCQVGLPEIPTFEETR